ncbi:MAG: hypothetical protein Devi2KO_28540 [Devosia indica]
MSTAPASEIQKNFGEWHDRAYEGPVEITRYGRTTAYLVSAKLFREMWASYRKVVAVEELSDSDMAMIRKATVESSEPFNLSDIPDIEETPDAPRMG